MSWITLTEDHIKARLSIDELDAYLEAGKQLENGVDSIASIIDQVTTMVRSYVASNSDNLPKMGAVGTIPDECLLAATTIARGSLLGSLPLSEGATEIRKEELRNAQSYLKSVASGDIRIGDTSSDYPEEPSAANASYGGSTLLEF